MTEDQVFTLLQIAISGLVGATSAIASQYIGARREERIRNLELAQRKRELWTSVVAPAASRRIEAFEELNDLLQETVERRRLDKSSYDRLRRLSIYLPRPEKARLLPASAARTEVDRKDRLYIAAKQLLTQISDRLQELVRENAPEAAPKARSSADWWSLKLGVATLAMDPPQPSPPSWGGFAPAFEVLAHATIAVLIPRNRQDFEGRSHSLWYCDAQESGVFRWYETAFMISPMIARQFYHRPAAMKPGEDAGKALWRGLAEYQVAYPFTPIDQGAESGFFERWLEWFATAAAGKFHAPTRLPEIPTGGSWRQA